MNTAPLTSLKQQNTKDLISLPEVDLYIIEPGIVVSEYKPDVLMDMTLALHVHEMTKQLTGGKSMPQLFIPGDGHETDIEVSKWGATEAANIYSTSVAVIARSLPHRMGANFFIRILNPVRPTKAFNNIDEAISWLSTFV